MKWICPICEGYMQEIDNGATILLKCDRCGQEVEHRKEFIQSVKRMVEGYEKTIRAMPLKNGISLDLRDTEDKRDKSV